MEARLLRNEDVGGEEMEGGREKGRDRDNLYKVWLWKEGERQGSSQEVRRLGSGRLGETKGNTKWSKRYEIQL